MKKIIATLIAGLFATAAFAQTPAPATTPAPAKAEAKVETKTEAKPEAKAEVKKVRHHKAKAKVAEGEKTATATPATPAVASK